MQYSMTIGPHECMREKHKLIQQHSFPCMRGQAGVVLIEFKFIQEHSFPRERREIDQRGERERWGGHGFFSLLFLFRWKIKSKYHHLLLLFSPLFKTIPSSNKAPIRITQTVGPLTSLHLSLSLSLSLLLCMDNLSLSLSLYVQGMEVEGIKHYRSKKAYLVQSSMQPILTT